MSSKCESRNRIVEHEDQIVLLNLFRSENNGFFNRRDATVANKYVINTTFDNIQNGCNHD